MPAMIHALVFAALVAVAGCSLTVKGNPDQEVINGQVKALLDIHARAIEETATGLQQLRQTFAAGGKQIDERLKKLEPEKDDRPPKAVRTK